MRLGLVDPQVGDLPLDCAEANPEEIASGVFALEAPSRTLTFVNVKRRPALSALRGFSAPVIVEDDLTETTGSPCCRATATPSTAGRLCRRSPSIC